MRTLIILFTLLMPGLAVAADVETRLTSELNGKFITYKYSGGRSYEIKFEPKGMSYRYLSGSKPEKWWGKFPYNALITDNGEYFVGWYEEGYGDYITLLINFESNVIYGSGILGDQSIHFEKASITSVK